MLSHYLDKEMKQMCYLGILKEGLFLNLLQSCMLISRKMTKDKRVVTDFRHLNYAYCQEQFGLPTFERYFFNARKF